MGLCRYCNTKAGLFKDAHDSCIHNAQSATTQLASLAAGAVKTRIAQDELSAKIAELKSIGRLSEVEVRTSLLRGADEAALSLAHESPISNDDAERIGEVFRTIDSDWFVDQSKRISCYGFLSVNLSNTLYQVMHGEVPYFPQFPLSFRILKNEHPIVRRNAVLAEYRNVSAGRTFHSVSMPVGSGVYYRLGASAPRTEHIGLVPIEEGEMLITTKSLYFGGANSAFRIPFASILRLESFIDGVGIYEDYGKGRVFIPGSLGFDDGWFFYNLISALCENPL